ncbi:MAG TPA: nuclease domain-containing protein, partial [Massilibacterium sp.]|nr:nuclease domain-containing protein [Massilibacterium sp.]
MNFQKPTKIRSKKITQSAKGEGCTLRIPGVCNHNPETVVFAHVNANKGIGSKGHDIHGFACCSACHAHYDSGKVDDSDVLRAL